MPHWTFGMLLAGALVVLGMGQARADTGDANAKGTDQSMTAPDPNAKTTTDTNEAAKADDTATAEAGTVDDTGHSSLDKPVPPEDKGTGTAGTVDDTGHSSLDKPLPPAGEGEQKSNSEGTQGD